MAETTQTEAEIIWRLIQQLNDAWLRGQAADVGSWLHDDVVLVQPGFAGRLVGRRACAKTWEDFAAGATVHRFEQSDAAIDVFGEVAITSYRFDVRYEWQGQLIDESGRDLLVWTRQNGDWKIVWRTVFVLPQPG
jgi:ketosteroid isomerase-like protein